MSLYHLLTPVHCKLVELLRAPQLCDTRVTPPGLMLVHMYGWVLQDLGACGIVTKLLPEWLLPGSSPAPASVLGDTASGRGGSR